jgi:hypothetical protein
MNRETTDKIIWKNSGSVNFAKLYKTEYIHPSVEAEIAQEELRRAADCAEDQELFDFDFEC